MPVGPEHIDSQLVGGYSAALLPSELEHTRGAKEVAAQLHRLRGRSRGRAWWPLPPWGLNRSSICTQSYPESLYLRWIVRCRAENRSLAKLERSSISSPAAALTRTLPPTRGASRGRSGRVNAPRAPRPTELQRLVSVLEEMTNEDKAST